MVHWRTTAGGGGSGGLTVNYLAIADNTDVTGWLHPCKHLASLRWDVLIKPCVFDCLLHRQVVPFESTARSSCSEPTGAPFKSAALTADLFPICDSAERRRAAVVAPAVLAALIAHKTTESLVSVKQ